MDLPLLLPGNSPGSTAPCLAEAKFEAWCLQAVAAVTSDGCLAVAYCQQADLWEETAWEIEAADGGLANGHSAPNEMDICEDAAPSIPALSAPLPSAAQQLLVRQGPTLGRVVQTVSPSLWHVLEPEEDGQLSKWTVCLCSPSLPGPYWQLLVLS